MLDGVITNATGWRSRKLQGYVNFQGLAISIENERGSYRQGTDAHGKPWRTFMHIKYGYIQLTEGVDGDHVDVYLGPNEFSDKAFVVHQVDPDTGKYDEDKCLLGMNNAAEAKANYVRQYDSAKYFGSMDEYDMDTFKRMLVDRRGLKLKKSVKENTMRINEENLDVGLELALNDLKKNLESGGGAGEKAGTVSRETVLQKAQVAFREGKISLVESGNLERRINKGRALKMEHRAILGLGPGDIVEGLREPTISNVSSRMGEASGGSAGKISTTGAPAPVNPVVEEMARGQKLLHNFQQPDNSIMTVSGAEILEKCRQLIREKKMTLLEAGDVERLINNQATIRPEVLRRLFTT